MQKQKFNRRINNRKTTGVVLNVILIITLVIALTGLIALLAEVLIKGLPWVSKNLIVNYPSRHPEQAGLLSALMGTIWVMVCTAIFSIPIGIGAAVYLEEYARSMIGQEELHALEIKKMLKGDDL